MAGVPTIAYGIGNLFGGGEEAAQVGAVLQDAVPQLLSGNWIGGALSLAFGVGAVILSERGQLPAPHDPRHDPRNVNPRDPCGREGGGGLY